MLRERKNQKMRYNEANFKLTAIFVILLNVPYLFLIARQEHSFAMKIKEEVFTSVPTVKIEKYFRSKPIGFLFSPQDDIILVGKPSFEESQPVPLVIVKSNKEVHIFWIYVTPFTFYIAFSPNHRFIAYSAGFPQKGIWVLDTFTKETKLVAPEFRDGKMIFTDFPYFLDGKHLIIKRVDTKQVEVSSVKNNGNHQKSTQVLRRLLSSIEEGIVDIETGEEKSLLPPGEELISVSPDKKWFYVVDRVRNKVLKVKADNPSVREEILNWYVPGLRLSWTTPLYIGMPYPPPTFDRPPSNKCRCYKLENGTLIFQKTVFYGDKKFPKTSIVYIAPNKKYSVGFGKSGLYLKQIDTKKVMRIEKKEIIDARWNPSSTKVAYIVKGKEVYEVWVYNIIRGSKQKVFP
jgi:hypothetical protein